MEQALGLVMRHLVAEHAAAMQECVRAEAGLRAAENADRDARMKCHALCCLKDNMASYLRSIAAGEGPSDALAVPDLDSLPDPL